MTKEQVLKMFKDFPDDNEFEFLGNCHDCKKETSVVIFRSPDSENGFEVDGGAVYQQDKKYLKCPECFEKNKKLTSFKEIDVYDRVVGYLSPIRQWNKGKLAELAQRKRFKMDSI